VRGTERYIYKERERQRNRKIYIYIYTYIERERQTREREREKERHRREKAVKRRIGSVTDIYDPSARPQTFFSKILARIWVETGPRPV
jgi:hypothetical protein